MKKRNNCEGSILVKFLFDGGATISLQTNESIGTVTSDAAKAMKSGEIVQFVASTGSSVIIDPTKLSAIVLEV